MHALAHLIVLISLGGGTQTMCIEMRYVEVCYVKYKFNSV